MKKIFNFLGLIVLIATVLLIGLIFSYKYIFTKTLNLSCEGEQTTSVRWEGGYYPKKMKNSHSVIVTIREYPFTKPNFTIQTEHEVFTSSRYDYDGLKISEINDQTIMVGNRKTQKDGSTFNAFTLNRLTGKLTIEYKTENENFVETENDLFEGNCKEVIPL